MKKFGRLKVAAVTGAAVAATGISLALASPAQAATDLGGVSVQGACNNQYPGTYAVVVQNNVYGWRCMTYWSGGPVYFSNINLTNQCGIQYGGSAYATYLDFNNPYSWQCYR